MKNVLILVLLVFASVSLNGQSQSEDYKVFKNLKRALKKKSVVYSLDLSGKNLDKIPPEVFELTNLKVLNLFDNRIEEIPESISSLIYLEVLILMRNDLGSVPQEIVELSNLKKLNLSQNDLYEKDVKFIEDALPDCLVIAEIIL